MKVSKYTAFDFETASGKNPCSIGIVVFENGEVVDEYYSLINPEIEKFNPFTIGIHGITENDVINEPNFLEVWEEISHFFENKIIVAHNSSFDLSVLNYSLERYNLTIPTHNSFCTLKISRQIIESVNYKLSTLAHHFSIEQNNYHNALEDAFVCGKLFQILMFQIDEIEMFENSNIHVARRRSKKKVIDSDASVVDKYFRKTLISELLNYQTDKLERSIYVVSGVFHKVSRNELKQLIEQNGGKVSSSISKKTSYVVAGDKMGPSKRTKAEGLGVPIISEDDFLGMIS